MNGAHNLVRRLAHDYVQRLRVALSGTIPDRVAMLGREAVEDLTESVCDRLGLDYEGPPDVPKRASDGRAAPWARKGKGKQHSAGG